MPRHQEMIPDEQQPPWPAESANVENHVNPSFIDGGSAVEVGSQPESDSEAGANIRKGSEALGRASRTITKQATELADNATDQARTMMRRVEGFVQSRPIVSILSALMVGMVVGLRRRRRQPNG